MTRLLDQIMEHLFGHKYYLVTIEKVQISNPNPKDVGTRMVSNYVFRTKQQAKTYFYQLKSLRTYTSVEIVSFRSKQYYGPHDNGWLSGV